MLNCCGPLFVGDGFTSRVGRYKAISDMTMVAAIVKSIKQTNNIQMHGAILFHRLKNK